MDAAADPEAEPNGGVFNGDFPIDRQRAALHAILGELGFEDEHWRLDASPHPFAQSPGHGDVRLTSRYRERRPRATRSTAACTSSATVCTTSTSAPALRRTPLHDCASLGIHESQSRLWENIVGRGAPVQRLAAPAAAGAARTASTDSTPPPLYRGLNVVQRSLIRTEADETTYNLHVALRSSSSSR